MPTIKLQSSDMIIFDTDVEIIQCSGTIRAMIANCSFEDETTVPLCNVSSVILSKVLMWANEHKDEPNPEDGEEYVDHRTPEKVQWDEEFLKVDQGTLYEIILAANYLDIKGLLELTCKAVANMIRGKTSDEIRKTFNIRDDFPPGGRSRSHPGHSQ